MAGGRLFHARDAATGNCVVNRLYVQLPICLQRFAAVGVVEMITKKK